MGILFPVHSSNWVLIITHHELQNFHPFSHLGLCDLFLSLSGWTRLGSLHIPSSSSQSRHSRTFRSSFPRLTLRLHRLQFTTQTSLSLLQNLQSKAFNGILRRAHPFRRLEPTRDGERASEQLGLRRSAGEGIGLRASVPPSHGVRPVRRLLEEPAENLGDSPVQPAAPRRLWGFSAGNRPENG